MQVNEPVQWLVRSASITMNGWKRPSQKEIHMKYPKLLTRSDVPIGLILAAVCLSLLPASALAARKVLPPHSNAFGRSAAEWSAAWWQWAYALTPDQHPLFDTADVSEGQSGRVWFLGGTFAATPQSDGSVLGEAERTVVIPNGTALFFPIINGSWDNLGNPPTTFTHAELQELVSGMVDHAMDLTCAIDGVNVRNLNRHRTTSGEFGYTLPEADENMSDFLLGFHYEGEVTPVAADGYYVMVAPLSVGEHTIHFGGSLVFTEAEDGFDYVFHLDITYHITVEPK